MWEAIDESVHVLAVLLRFLRTEATLERRVWFALAVYAERSFEGGFGKERVGGEEERGCKEV